MPPAVSTDTSALYFRTTSIESQCGSSSNSEGNIVSAGAVCTAVGPVTCSGSVVIVQRTPTQLLNEQVIQHREIIEYPVRQSGQRVVIQKQGIETCKRIEDIAVQTRPERRQVLGRPPGDEPRAVAVAPDLDRQRPDAGGRGCRGQGPPGAPGRGMR